jgi:hypothetical protein
MYVEAYKRIRVQKFKRVMKFSIILEPILCKASDF